MQALLTISYHLSTRCVVFVDCNNTAAVVLRHWFADTQINYVDGGHTDWTMIVNETPLTRTELNTSRPHDSALSCLLPRTDVTAEKACPKGKMRAICCCKCHNIYKPICKYVSKRIYKQQHTLHLLYQTINYNT